jgi:hypothetical protein
MVGNLSPKGFHPRLVGASRQCPCVWTAIGVANRFAIRFPSELRGKSAIADTMVGEKPFGETFVTVQSINALFFGSSKRSLHFAPFPPAMIRLSSEII